MSTKMATGETSICHLIPMVAPTIVPRSKERAGGIEVETQAETPGRQARASDRR